MNYESRTKDKIRAYLEVHGFQVLVDSDDPRFWPTIKNGLYTLRDEQLEELNELMKSGGWVQ